MLVGPPINLDQAIEFFHEILSDFGKKTLLSKEPRPAINYIKSALKQMTWAHTKLPFGRFIQDHFGLSDYTDVAYLIAQGLIAKQYDEFFNPYDYAVECREVWSELGIDPISGKKIIILD